MIEKKFCLAIPKNEYTPILCQMATDGKEIENLIVADRHKTVHAKRMSSFFLIADAEKLSQLMVHHGFRDIHEVLGEYKDEEIFW